MKKLMVLSLLVLVACASEPSSSTQLSQATQSQLSLSDKSLKLHKARTPQQNSNQKIWVQNFDVSELRRTHDIKTLADGILEVNKNLIQDEPTQARLTAVHEQKTADIEQVIYQQEALVNGEYLPVFNTLVAVILNNHNNAHILNLSYKNIDGITGAKLSAQEAAVSVKRLLDVVTIELQDGSSRLLPLTVSNVTGAKLGVYADLNNQAKLVYEQQVEAWVSINGEAKRYDQVVYTDAHTGELVTVAAANKGVAGIADVFDPDAFEMNDVALLNVPIHGLDNSGYLRSKDKLNIINTVFTDLGLGLAYSPTNDFTYANDGFPNDAHISEANAYNTLYKRKVYMDAMGFDLMNFAIVVDAMDPNAFESNYNYLQHRIALATGILDAKSGDVSVHEYAHETHHDTTGGGVYRFTTPSATLNSAIDEGSCDYNAYTTYNDKEIFEHIFRTELGNRRLTLSENHVDNPSSIIYRNGTKWASFLWHFRRLVGKGVADRVAIQFVYHIVSTDDFNSALETALIPALHDLYGGLYETELRNAASLYKIYGNNPGYRIPVGVVASDMPYADSTNQNFSYTLPGAVNGIAVTFDANTSFGENGDTLTIKDASNNVIGVYTGEQLRGATIDIPNSDTINITLFSATDGKSGHGFNIVNVVPLPAPGTPAPTLFVLPSAAGGMDPYLHNMVVFSGAELVSLKVDMGDGTIYYPSPHSGVVNHIYNRAIDTNYNDTIAPGPILTATSFPVTVTATASNGVSATKTVQVNVVPYEEPGFDVDVDVVKIPLNPTGRCTKKTGCI